MNTKLIFRPYSEQFVPLSPTTISVESFKSQMKSLPRSSPKNRKNIDISSEFTLDYPLASSPITSNASLQDMNVKILDIKCFVASYISIKPDTLSLYLYTVSSFDKFLLLNDNENYLLTSNADQKTCLSTQHKKLQSSARSNDYKQHIFYFKITREKHKVIIDVFQNQIDKIMLDISISCSIYMLKYLINTHCGNNTIPMNDLSIYGVGYVDNTNYVRKKLTFNKALSNKKFNDTTILDEIIKYYSFETKDSSDSILNLILIKKSKKKCSMGLDFRFNHLKNFIKIDFTQDAPSYHEASDGLNLFIYCGNTRCELAEKFYVIAKGYGKYDLMDDIKSIKCPMCHSNKKNLKNIGFIKSKWKYGGLLTCKKDSKFDGDGLTLDNKLYVFPEIVFNNQFQILIIEIEPYLARNHYCFNIDGDNEEEEESSDLEDVSLCLPKEKDPEDNGSFIVPFDHQDHQEMIEGKKQRRINEKDDEIIVEGKKSVIPCGGCTVFSNREDRDRNQSSSGCIII